MKDFFNPKEHPKWQVSRTVGRSRKEWTFLWSRGPGPLSAGAGSRDRVVWASRKTQNPKGSKKHIKDIYNCSTLERKADTQQACFSCSSWNKGCERCSHHHILLESCPKDRQNCSYTSTCILFSFMPNIIAEGSSPLFFSYDIDKRFYFLYWYIIQGDPTF